MFPEFLRVKQVDTDWEVSVTRAMYDVARHAYELLDEPAVDDGNNPLPPVKRAEKKPVARQAANPGHEADPKKES